MTTPYQDIQIYDSLSYNASTWRRGGVPSYATYGPSTPVYYTGVPYTPPSATTPDNTFSENVSAIYGQVFWETFFETLFPQISTDNFLNEKSTGTPGGYFKQLYEIAMRDFYDSYFRGRDDLGGTNTYNTIVTTSMWNSLSDDEKRLVIKKYLFTRSTVAASSYLDENGFQIQRQYTGNMFLRDLNLRTTNVFFYVAALMVRVMGQLQENTINAGRYATRLAETQKTVSTEMTSSKYSYQTLDSQDDYGAQQANEQNGLALENLRLYRDQLQKETDRASNFLETSQQAVEEQGSKALEFLKKGQELSQLFYRGL